MNHTLTLDTRTIHAPPQGTAPTPARVFEDLFAFRRTAALRAAIELHLFDALEHGPQRLEGLAQITQSAPRGLRALCDFLVAANWLTKSDGAYRLVPEARAFLVRRNPGYIGDAHRFLAGAANRAAFDDLTEIVRSGHAQTDAELEAGDHPHWAEFARSMQSLQRLPATLTADIVRGTCAPLKTVLDVSAGHGLFGLLAIAGSPDASCVALDWPDVLTVAHENARRLGLTEHFSTIEGGAFDSDFGGPYDVVLLPNYLHHYGVGDVERILRKAHAALRPQGTVVIVDFVPNEDRVSPPMTAQFALVMLVKTPAGDVYTQAEFETLLERAGFRFESARALHPTPQTAIVARRA